MGRETERKFLTLDPSWKTSAVSSKELKQRYITTAGTEHRTIRLRIAEKKAFLTLKTAAAGLTRGEYEYEIPLEDALEIYEKICDTPAVEKRRYLVPYHGKTWEVDEFSGGNAGLVVAEIELTSPDEPFDLPPWAGREVTGDHRYSNTALAAHPYTEWQNKK